MYFQLTKKSLKRLHQFIFISVITFICVLCNIQPLYADTQLPIKHSALSVKKMRVQNVSFLKIQNAQLQKRYLLFKIKKTLWLLAV